MKVIGPFAPLLLLGAVAAALAFAEDAAKPSPPPEKGQAVAVFAGGCFWSEQHDFDGVQGIVSIRVGYTGGKTPHPSYEEVSTGSTGHVESVRITYDPKKVTYEQLVKHYFRHVDPVSGDGQFCDFGDEYRPFIFVSTPQEKETAQRESKAVEAKMGQKVAVQIAQAGPFWDAEEYHQDFARKNPGHYFAYRRGCGRDGRLAEIQKKLDAK